MAKYIYQISENIIKPNVDTCYVRATEDEITLREYRGGFARFNSGCFAESKKFPRGTKINGREILSLRKFDNWLKEHDCL